MVAEDGLLIDSETSGRPAGDQPRLEMADSATGQQQDTLELQQLRQAKVNSKTDFTNVRRAVLLDISRDNVSKDDIRAGLDRLGAATEKVMEVDATTSRIVR